MCANYQFIIRLINIRLNIIMKFSTELPALWKQSFKNLFAASTRMFSPWRDTVRGETGFLVLACCFFFCFLLAPLGCLAGTHVSVLAGAPCPSLTPRACTRSASPQPQPQPSNCLSAPPRTDPTWPSCQATLLAQRRPHSLCPAAHQPWAVCTTDSVHHSALTKTCSAHSRLCVALPELVSQLWVPFATCTPDVFLCTLEGCFCLPGNRGPAWFQATLKTSFPSNGLQPRVSIDPSPDFRKQANRQACPSLETLP